MPDELQSILFISPIIELIVLFLLSRLVINQLAKFLYVFIKGTKWVYYLLAFLFLPGTYIHELSHFIMAKILFVPVVGFSLRPRIIGHEIHLGHVEIAKPGFIRRFLVGIAPILFGSILLVGSIYLLFLYKMESQPLFIFLESLLVFEVGNTMFMSKKDMEGSWKIVLFGGIVILLLYILGLEGSWFIPWINQYQSFLSHISLYLLVPIVIDLLLIIITGLFV